MNMTPGLNTELRGKPLETLLQELPADLRSEVRNFVEFLLLKRTHVADQCLHQDLSSIRPERTMPLKGTVLRYDEPFASVAETEWEALQ